MTLDEAIQHSREKAECLTGECKVEHEQLVEWLEDLKKVYDIIPKGLYCYTTLEGPCNENKWVHKVDLCPFYENIKDGESAYCHLINEEDCILLADSCKICNINTDEN